MGPMPEGGDMVAQASAGDGFTRLGSQPLLPVPFDAKMRLRRVKWCRWHRFSKSELREDDSGQIWGDPSQDVGLTLPDPAAEGLPIDYKARFSGLVKSDPVLTNF